MLFLRRERRVLWGPTSVREQASCPCKHHLLRFMGSSSLGPLCALMAPASPPAPCSTCHGPLGPVSVSLTSGVLRAHVVLPAEPPPGHPLPESPLLLPIPLHPQDPAWDPFLQEALLPCPSAGPPHTSAPHREWPHEHEGLTKQKGLQDLWGQELWPHLAELASLLQVSCDHCQTPEGVTVGRPVV